MVTIGVLAFQGDFARHVEAVSRVGGRATLVRRPDELNSLDGLIIPGGESTTIGMLMDRFGLLETVRERVAEGMALFGTCAGAILMARDIEGSEQPRLGLLPMGIRRNAYGSQIESFEAEVQVEGLGAEPFGMTAVFIRAPVIVDSDASVKTLARFESAPVLVQQERMLAATFHPELTGNDSIHRYFVAIAAERQGRVLPPGSSVTGRA